MAVIDQGIVKNNILMLMRKRNISQSELSKAIDMSQSNLSTALNQKSKRFFSVDQICSIAECLNVSLNSLLNLDASKNQSIDLRQIGEFIIELLKAGRIELTGTGINELVTVEKLDDDEYMPSDLGGRYQGVPYITIVFPNFSEHCEREVALPDGERARVNSTGNKPINDFLKKLPDIQKLYREGRLPEDAYDTIIQSYLEQLENSTEDDIFDIRSLSGLSRFYNQQ